MSKNNLQDIDDKMKLICLEKDDIHLKNETNQIDSLPLIYSDKYSTQSEPLCNEIDVKNKDFDFENFEPIKKEFLENKELINKLKKQNENLRRYYTVENTNLRNKISDQNYIIDKFNSPNNISSCESKSDELIKKDNVFSKMARNIFKLKSDFPTPSKFNVFKPSKSDDQDSISVSQSHVELPQVDVPMNENIFVKDVESIMNQVKQTSFILEYVANIMNDMYDSKDGIISELSKKKFENLKKVVNSVIDSNLEISVLLEGNVDVYHHIEYLITHLLSLPLFSGKIDFSEKVEPKKLNYDSDSNATDDAFENDTKQSMKWYPRDSESGRFTEPVPILSHSFSKLKNLSTNEIEVKLKQRQLENKELNKELISQKKYIDNLEKIVKTRSHNVEKMLQNVELKVECLEDNFAKMDKKIKEQMTKEDKAMKNLKERCNNIMNVANTEHEKLRRMKSIKSEHEKELNIKFDKYYNIKPDEISQADVKNIQSLLHDYRDYVISSHLAYEDMNQVIKENDKIYRQSLNSENEKYKKMKTTYEHELEKLSLSVGANNSICSEMERQTSIIHSLEDSKMSLNKEINTLKSKYSNNMESMKSDINDRKSDNTYLIDKNYHLEKQVILLKNELNAGEIVQKDFVRLSQKLQIDLESIRKEKNTLRWEFAEEIDMCKMCKIGLNKNKDKRNCLHCGKIHCFSCTTKLFRPSNLLKKKRVCDLCYTLLENSTPPHYFVSTSKK
ncbi:hypothetical protein A3Q56_00870 [Intoshia linei]|uniref:FYVE-type domain-containing protein n=1 Tax=Intoshia linei TaxID=1819745 RepID=A0A177BAZ1_9BILA|nr:hypothetical protein A3Q56_00870 [Intoshia linei]